MYAHLIRSLKRRKYRNSIITRGLQHYIPSDIGLFYPPPYQVCRISKLSYLFHHCISRNISRHIRFSFVLPCLMSRQILKVKTENILQKQFEGYFLKCPYPTTTKLHNSQLLSKIKHFKKAPNDNIIFFTLKFPI